VIEREKAREKGWGVWWLRVSFDEGDGRRRRRPGVLGIWVVDHALQNEGGLRWMTAFTAFMSYDILYPCAR